MPYERLGRLSHLASLVDAWFTLSDEQEREAALGDENRRWRLGKNEAVVAHEEGARSPEAPRADRVDSCRLSPMERVRLESVGVTLGG